ncbi:hypothetical protein [Saccharicrinis fermentans]|uniref:Uncharacterized protein n=1 Tax=Saccharicrinis fermentans DSM 9555 = JCM 21142 TaxID=869213 RepID=W7YAW6_9BACT|nr:hypothetical protein [Saccharicrinis fermentans]GAF01506.1 hypothetical protein JCM21142_114 [Saccharicrinis fermentans DSM 9555 = JCM 21142]
MTVKKNGWLVVLVLALMACNQKQSSKKIGQDKLKADTIYQPSMPTVFPSNTLKIIKNRGTSSLGRQC